MNIINILLISLPLLLLIVINLAIKIIRLKQTIKTLSLSYSKIQTLLSLKDNNVLDNDVHEENFIKFLSDSRESAYEYIETVQKSLDDFINDIDADISYFDEYGDVLSVERPDYAAMKNISKAYKELKKILPEKE